MACFALPSDGLKGIAPRPLLRRPRPLVGQPIRTPPSREGSGPKRGDLLQTGSVRREPDIRRESAKTASPFERATIRRRLPAVRGGQQAATGRRAGSAER